MLWIIALSPRLVWQLHQDSHSLQLVKVQLGCMLKSVSNTRAHRRRPIAAGATQLHFARNQARVHAEHC
jgi:hypothetical protein